MQNLKQQTKKGIIEAINKQRKPKLVSIKTINNQVYSSAKHEINCIVSVAVQNLMDCGTVLEAPEFQNEVSFLIDFESKVWKNYVIAKDSKERADKNSIEFLNIAQELLSDMDNDYKIILSFLYYYLNENNKERQKELNTPNGQRLKNAVKGLITKLGIVPEKHVEYAI